MNKLNLINISTALRDNKRDKVRWWLGVVQCPLLSTNCLNNIPPEEVSRSGRQDSIMRNERERKGSFSLESLDYFNGLNGFDEIL